MVTNKEKIVELRKQNQILKATEIAKQLGISRERVRQILVTLGLPTYFQPKEFYCNQCGVLLSSRVSLCPECRYKKIYALYICDADACARQFPMRRKYYKYMIEKRGYKHFFCSKKCSGQFAGIHYGFRAHPENVKTRRKINV